METSHDQLSADRICVEPSHPQKCIPHLDDGRLGCPWGRNLSQKAIHKFCIGRIEKRLASWSARLLSFAGWIVLIKHILEALPIYNLMFMKTSKTEAEKMENLCKDFLWGRKKIGNRKTPMISWRRLSRPKSEGGLGILTVLDHADALLCNWITKALNDPRSEWAILFKELLRFASWSRAKLYRKQKYTKKTTCCLGIRQRSGECSIFLGCGRRGVASERT